MSSDSPLFVSPPPPPSSNGATTKRQKQYPPFVVPAGHVSIRMLCHTSLIGQFIGKSGASIKNLQLETSSKIRVEQSLLQSSQFRIILIVAPSIPSKWIKLRNYPNDVDVEVSAVQEAALRVFEKVLEVSGEGNTTLCRLLVDGGGAGCVIGKGGKTVEKLRKETGAKIRVLLGDHLPPGIPPPHEVIEIEGDALAVKKALIGVCNQLQECLQGDKLSIKDSRPLESTSQSAVHDFRANPPLHLPPVSMALPNTSSSPAVFGRTSFETDMFPISDSKVQQQLVFKILCSNSTVGGVIGRGGSIVKALQEESGANINVGSNVANCDERLITISSMEDVDSRYSPAQRAVVLVFSRSIEAAAEREHETVLNKGPIVSARLLVPSNQIGCLLGKGGIIISEMRKATGTSIYVHKGDQVPKFAAQDDVVVEISGQFVNTKDALYQITSRLRDNLFTSKVMKNPGTENANLTSDSSINGRVMNPASLQHTMDHFVYVGLQTSEAAEVNFAALDSSFASSNGGVEHDSTHGPAIITNTTAEVLVPESSISSVYGENGSNLTRIRQISGAKVIVREALPGMSHRTVFISGTPDETQAAQSLLHAFTLTWSS